MSAFISGFLVSITVFSIAMAVWESRMEIHWCIRRSRAAKHRMALRKKKATGATATYENNG